MTTMAMVVALVSAGADGSWALASFETININPGYERAAVAVLRGHLESLGKTVVELPVVEGTSDPADRAREHGASVLVRGTLTRLGEKVKVRLTVVDLGGGSPRDGSLDAMSPEDLDTVLMRLARHFVHGEPLNAGSARIDEVIEEEEQAYARRKANSYFGVLVQATPAAAGTSRTALAGGSLFWLYDARQFLADLQLGFGVAQGDNRGGLGGFAVAILYPFSDRDTAPYIGGGIGYDAMEVGNKDGAGIRVLGAAGLLFGRASTVTVRAEVRPFVTTYSLAFTPWDGSKSEGHAYGAQLGLGIGF